VAVKRGHPCCDRGELLETLRQKKDVMGESPREGLYLTEKRESEGIS